MRSLLPRASCLFVLCIPLATAGDEIVLDPAAYPEPRNMMGHYLKGLASAAFENRKAEIDAIGGPDDVRARQEKLRAFFIDRIGGFPERTPLNPQIIGESEHEGFKLQRIIFESRPKFFVTAAFYLPLSAGPWPAVVMPCGHSANGKAEETYQRLCVLLARNGIAAFCYDPIGQGERYQILDESGRPRFGSTLEHMLAGAGSILLGLNTASYRIWDGIRAIDYLVERDDIVAEKIGVAGNSGGGTLTSYLMALDSRIAAAAPACYITSFERLVNTIGPQDAEQNIFGQIEAGFDHADFLLLFAPRPALICAATKDFFDIGGTRATFSEAQRMYKTLGAPDAVSMTEAEAEHGYSPELRKATAAWMKRWLLGDNSGVEETDFSPLTAEQLQCTPKGQVQLIEGARSVFQINQELDIDTAPRRHFPWEERPKDQSFDIVRRLTGIPPLDKPSVGEYDVVFAEQRPGYDFSMIVLKPEKDIYLPALAYISGNATGNAYVMFHGDGKAATIAECERLVQRGHAVLTFDLRGIGETAKGASSAESFDAYCGADWQEYFLAYLLDKSYVGMRAQDIITTLRFVEHFVPEFARRRIYVTATGQTAIPALHAAALAPDLYTSIRLDQTILSWTEVLGAPVSRNQLINTIHGALREYDLRYLITSLPPGKLRIGEHANAAGD